MINKRKYVISLFAVLFIGFVLGYLVNGRLTRMHISKMQNYFTVRGFNRALIRIIEPTPQQMKQLDPILKKYARKNRRRMFEMRMAQKNSFDSLEMELKPYLTPAQIERFEKYKKRRQKHFMLFHHNKRPKKKKNLP